MNERLNTQDLIEILIMRQGLEKKHAENFVKEFFAVIEEGLEKDKSVKVKGLGTFKLIDVESRESVNVNTGERIEIQGHTKISFIPDPAIRDIINKPFAHFETVILNEDVNFNELTEGKEKEETIVDLIEVEEKEEIATVLGAQKNETKEIGEQIQEELKEETTTREEINATTIMDKPEDLEVIPTSTPGTKTGKDSSNNKVLIIVVILTTLLCGILLFFTYYSDIFSEKKKQNTTISNKDNIIGKSAMIDSTAIAAKDSIKGINTPKEMNIEKPVNPSVPAKAKRDNTIPFSQIPVKADSTSYEIIGNLTRHTIQEGQTLIRISYRYYKTKDLWPYLVMHNPSIIKDPNNVPIGTTINIPELKKK